MFIGSGGRGSWGRRGGRSFPAGRHLGATSDVGRDRAREADDEEERARGGGGRAATIFAGGPQRGGRGFRGERGRGWPRVGIGARRGSAGTDWNGQYGYQSYDWRPRQGDSYIRRQVSPRTSGAAGFGKDTEEGNKKKGSEGGREGADEVMKEAGEEEGGAEQGGGTKCSRCTKRGHMATNCEIELFCVICSAHVRLED
ncbi:hypothetical protein PVAP13_4KG030458 [Panicum virgatum]|uniref:CCHC-type domain-containing protein n=1 Tax=Panicum virgatum TaxID=38727 RepID=A0A8T0TGG0_PANVG|nr:hypothetical protein PVAP13_4KG030458 [Panicum virgatum]